MLSITQIVPADVDASLFVSFAESAGYIASIVGGSLVSVRFDQPLGRIAAVERFGALVDACRYATAWFGSAVWEGLDR